MQHNARSVIDKSKKERFLCALKNIFKDNFCEQKKLGD